jgi:2-(1,2-epoxy-1,2-dihydrophenyl)acetyl-CoA isomerase
MELMLLGEKLPAPKALEWGLINRVVPDADVEDTAFALAADLAKGPTRALGLIRQIAWKATDTDLATSLMAEREAQRETGRSSDFREGVQAFLEKRAAVFIGK